jgi:hypothetical protein
MAQDKFITIRVDEETKSRLEAAANARGVSLTTFLLRAADEAAKKGLKTMTITLEGGRIVKPHGRGACPSFFVGQCHEAARGGANGYFSAGRELARHVGRLCSYDVEEDEWNKRLADLGKLLDAGFEGTSPGRTPLLISISTKDEAVLEWFDKEVPRCMAIVPRKRRKQFLAGVYAAYEEFGDEILTY